MTYSKVLINSVPGVGVKMKTGGTQKGKSTWNIRYTKMHERDSKKHKLLTAPYTTCNNHLLSHVLTGVILS